MTRAVLGPTVVDSDATVGSGLGNRHDGTVDAVLEFGWFGGAVA